jgi:hypothetical protein
MWAGQTAPFFAFFSGSELFDSSARLHDACEQLCQNPRDGGHVCMQVFRAKQKGPCGPFRFFMRR